MAMYGKVISKYRRLENLTQKDLAEKLFVSPQTVSKWENNQSEPNLATIKQLADLFGISVDDFFEEEKTFSEKEAASNVDVLKCEMCLDIIDEDKTFKEEERILCDKCKEDLESEESFNKSHKEKEEVRKGNTKLKGIIPFYIGWGIGIFVFILSLIIAITSDELNGFIDIVLSPFILSYIIMAFLTQMFYDSWLKDFIGFFMGRRFSRPGIIFELSLKGIIQLIVIKIIFGLAVFLFSLFVYLIGLVLAVIISPVSYVVELITKISKGFDYEL